MAQAVRKKSWAEKMKKPALPEVKILAKGFADLKDGSNMLIPTPALIAAYLYHTTPGKRVDLSQMRKDLALANGADGTCPLTTGIFLRILAEYTHERQQAGEPLETLAPVWRVIHPGLPIWKKLSFDKKWLEDAFREETER